MIEVKIRAFGAVKNKINKKNIRKKENIFLLELESEAEIADVMEKLGISEKDLMHPMLNGKKANAQTKVKDDDVIYFLPPLTGG